jgi:hypothetical protein
VSQFAHVSPICGIGTAYVKSTQGEIAGVWGGALALAPVKNQQFKSLPARTVDHFG